MSMHKIPLTDDEREGLQAHGLDIGTPSQLSDVFRQGMAWSAGKSAAECERLRDTLSAAQRVTVAVIDERDAALAELAALKGGREERREWPDDDIVAAWKWCEENGGTPAEFLSYSLLGKRSRVLGRPLTWREAIELTHATTDMSDAQRDKLLAMDDAPPTQASAWVPEGLRELAEAVATLDKVPRTSGHALPKPEQIRAEAAVIRAARAMLAAAPTPGDSDGKGDKP